MTLLYKRHLRLTEFNSATIELLSIGSKVAAAFAFQIAKIQFHSPVDTVFIHTETRH